ncbi:MAG: M28 family peptidase [Cyclobacteriaceae bacterium]|nr:M28 family peptidase [Cyclobacteriaceae bacterium]
MIRYFLLPAWLILYHPLFAQEIPADAIRAYEKIEPKAIRAHMRFLADDMLEGRKPFSRGYQLATHYVAVQFEEMGLKPGVGDSTYYQPVNLFKNKSSIEGTLNLQFNNETRTLVPGEDFLLVSHPEEIDQSEKEIIFGGIGVQDPSMGFNDMEKLDVKDKYVILYYQHPVEESIEFNLKHMGDHRIFRLKDAGAAGIIMYIPERVRSRFTWENIKYFLNRQKYEAGYIDFPVFLMDWDIINSIFERLKPDLDAYESGKAIPAEIKVKAFLKPDININRDYEISVTSNVIAYLEGSDPELKNEFFIYTAHLDHEGIGPAIEGDSIYNGAYDNASGIAIMLEMAKTFMRLETPPKRSILFIALSAEEMGLLGSEYYVSNPVVPLGNTSAVLNLDMFLMEKPLDEMVVLGKELSGLGQMAYRVCELLDIRIVPDPLPEENIFMRSDHYNFARKGIPSLFLINSYHKSDINDPDSDVNYRWLKTIYHSPLDNFRENIHYESGVIYGQINFLIGFLAAEQQEKVQWNFDFEPEVVIN